MNGIERFIDVAANIFTIAASGIAIYLVIFERDKISAAFKTLINYSTQMTLTELISKIDRLNDLHADSDEGRTMAINILCEIEGQIKGNSKLTKQFPEVLLEIEGFTSAQDRIADKRSSHRCFTERAKLR